MMTLRQSLIVGPNPVDPWIFRASAPSSIRPFSHRSGRSRFNLSNAYAFFGVIGIFAGAYSSLSSALAEPEESAGQETSSPSSSTPTLSNGTLTNLLSNSYADEEVARYLSTLDGSRNAADPVDRDVEKYAGSHPAFHSSTSPEGFDDLLIPETVWSLDANTGGHLDHISGGPDSDIYAVFNSRMTVNNFWIKEIFGSWMYNNSNKDSGFFFTPIQFQVASCGGSSAERSNLEYCNNVTLLNTSQDDPPVKSAQNNSNTATQSASNNVFLSNGPASSNSASQPITAPSMTGIPGPALLDPQFPLQNSLNVLGPCDVSDSCADVEMDPLDAPVDAPVDPVLLPGDPTLSIVLPPSEPPISGPTGGGGDPGSGPPQVFPQLPEPVATPEASTWVMTVVGFGFMAFTFGKRRRLVTVRPRLYDVSEET
jgi:hypothetical protein